MSSIAQILVRPIVTEKSTSQLNGANDYAFEVSIDANKAQIKSAIEAFYGVTVEDVRTMVVRGKVKRSGRHFGKRRNWKKAYVRLAEGDALNIYEV